MRRSRLLAGGVVAVAAIAVGSVVTLSRATRSAPAAQEPPANTMEVELGTLSAMVSLDGTLTYRARSDGSPYAAINQAHGTYTKLPDVGDKVACGEELYRVDDKPVLLLCGAVPAYRDLHVGDAGNDVRQLNTNLHALGDDAAAGVAIAPDDNAFTAATEQALEKLQQDKGVDATGRLAIDDAVFLPVTARIAKVAGELGGSAQPGAQVAQATSDTLEVQVALEGSQQRAVKNGDRAQITLPDNTSVTGTVDRLGAVTQAPAGPNGDAGKVTIPVYLTLDEPEPAKGLDQAPVQVEITTQGVDGALSVPVTAIVGKSGGGFAVEVVRDDGRHELVPVKLGLFDTTSGRVQVNGDLREGERAVVPSS